MFARKFSRRSLLVVAIAVLTLATLPPSAASCAWSLNRCEYYTELQSSLFSTESYYDRDGNRTAIPAPIVRHRPDRRHPSARGRMTAE